MKFQSLCYIVYIVVVPSSVSTVDYVTSVLAAESMPWVL